METSSKTSVPIQNPIRVAIIDDQQIVRAGFSMVINSQPDMHVEFEANDGEQALRLLPSYPVDVILMDIRMPKLNGIQTTQYITSGQARLSNRNEQKPKIIILTTYDLDDYVIAAIKAGASGFLLKSAEPEELLRSIRAVYAGDAVLAPSTTKRVVEKLLALFPTTNTPSTEIFETLTDRERDVIIALSRGLNNQEIAEELFVSETTVKTHVGHIFQKLGVRDRVQAVVIAYESGIVKPAQ